MLKYFYLKMKTFLLVHKFLYELNKKGNKQASFLKFLNPNPFLLAFLPANNFYPLNNLKSPRRVRNSIFFHDLSHNQVIACTQWYKGFPTHALRPPIYPT